MHDRHSDVASTTRDHVAAHNLSRINDNQRVELSRLTDEHRGNSGFTAAGQFIQDDGN